MGKLWILECFDGGVFTEFKLLEETHWQCLNHVKILGNTLQIRVWKKGNMECFDSGVLMEFKLLEQTY